MWNLIIGPIAELAKTVVGGFVDSAKAKRELKAAKQETELAIERARAQADIDWDQQAMINAQTSWKDEYLLILFSIPLILCFVPEFGPPIVRDGFNVLKETPDWYKASIGVMVAASYGFKKLTDFYGNKK